MSSDGLSLPPSPINEGGDSGSSDFDNYVDDGSTSSSSSSFDEVEDEDFPQYFTERDDRLFHSNPAAPYPLPIDTPEQQRHTVLHNMLKRLMGGNFVGPVEASLAPGPGKKALDLCNGNGKWLLEMSEDFPHVDFSGIDNVPIATRYPPENVRFVLADVNAELDWTDNTFDFVHARDTAMAVLDYRHLVSEAARVLKPGGLFLSVEWDRSPHFQANFDLDPEENVPASVHFNDLVDQALFASHGIRNDPLQCSDALFESPRFVDVQTREFYAPIGGWHEEPDLQRMGVAFKVAQSRLARACKYLLVDHTELSSSQVDAIIQDCVEELRSTPGLMSTVHVAYGTKAAA